ncbi:VOC family protein [Herbidospora sp. NBRC 101105]|uniref:VOC family protein n=1 Tax=Herbidospora sp. NBRC 101105 TaxID=3032195 RepID=UPI0024A37B60|nr:VOC family protein [Herbidospora sp. NBRC 101105]GLX96622.1 glyoxalase [Herbidospora sp. NBRC 101105]
MDTIPLGRPAQLVVDCADPASLAVFWGRLLGTPPVHRDPSWSYVDGVVRIAFQRVPEPKTGKNRAHLDVEVADVAVAAATAVAWGARESGPLRTDAQGSFQVMRDPEGNEFCLVSNDHSALSSPNGDG